MSETSHVRNARSSRLRIAVLLLSVLLGSCSDDTERNLITDRAPFYQTKVEFDQARMNAVIQTVRSFSEEHHTDFLLAHETLGPGEFNASSVGYSLNLSAMHIEPFDKDVVSISAIARAAPTPQQKTLVNEFVNQVRSSAQSRR
jgi:hypothetical protein